MKRIFACLVAIIALGAIALSIYILYSTPVGDKVTKRVEIQSSSLPIAVINTSAPVNKKAYIIAEMTLIANDSTPNYIDSRSHPGQHLEFDNKVQIKYHGYSSYKISNKKSYALKLLNKNKKKKKHQLLGMANAHSWILQGPFIDRSCIRDKFTYDLFRPYFDYMPQLQPVEVVVNGTYKGIYYLTEKISQHSNGLNIGEHGHIVKIDRKREDCGYYKSRYLALGTDVYYDYVYPDRKDFSKGKTSLRREDINKQIAAFEDAIYDGNLKYIDLKSFAAYFIATEFMGNADGYRCSVFMYKRDDDPTHYRMLLWDNDRTYGNSYRHENYDWTKWIYQTDRDFDRNVPEYWPKLIEHPKFKAEVKRQWKEMRSDILTEKHTFAALDSLHNMLVESGAQSRNDAAYAMWTRGRFFPMTKEQGKFSSIDEEIDYIKRWIHHRLIEMDKLILEPTPKSKN